MSRWMSLIVCLLSSVVAFQACKFENEKGGGSGSTLSGRLQSDIARLTSFTLVHPTNSFATTLNLPDSSQATILNYLDRNINFIVPEMADQDIQNAISIVNQSFTYPPYTRFDDAAGAIIMSNLGAGIYDTGKEFNVLLAFQIPGGPSVTVTSPLAGLLMVGEGLWDPNYSVDPENPEADANTLDRLGTLVHESRHSEGHDVPPVINRGFIHSVCPAGHPLAGAYACDKCTNGPYAGGAAFLEMAANSCGPGHPENPQCTPEQLAILSFFAADSRNRLLSGATACPWQPEGTFDVAPFNINGIFQEF